MNRYPKRLPSVTSSFEQKQWSTSHAWMTQLHRSRTSFALQTYRYPGTAWQSINKRLLVSRETHLLLLILLPKVTFASRQFGWSDVLKFEMAHLQQAGKFCCVEARFNISISDKSLWWLACRLSSLLHLIKYFFHITQNDRIMTWPNPQSFLYCRDQWLTFLLYVEWLRLKNHSLTWFTAMVAIQNGRPPMT